MSLSVENELKTNDHIDNNSLQDKSVPYFMIYNRLSKIKPVYKRKYDWNYVVECEETSQSHISIRVSNSTL